MKLTLILFSLFILVHSNPVVLYRETAPGVFFAENLTGPFPRYKASDDDVKIYYRNQGDPINKNPIDLSNTTAVNEFGFSNTKDTVFIVHGWQNEYDSPICEEVSEAVLKVKDANVFIVDWSKIAKSLYLIAYQAVGDVGKILSKLIQDLVKDNGLDLDKTFIVGHSLGAHVAGLAGAALNGDIDHIVGLDPAGPMFGNADIDRRLDETDAKFVQVIHTCAGLLGYNGNLGHVDYWPNGGSNQPGCHNDIVGSCSHGRSYLYFAESVVSGGFLSRKCDSYVEYNGGVCESAPTSLMGEYTPDKKASGSYFLKTNDEPPYAQN